MTNISNFEQNTSVLIKNSAHTAIISLLQDYKKSGLTDLFRTTEVSPESFKISSSDPPPHSLL